MEEISLFKNIFIEDKSDFRKLKNDITPDISNNPLLKFECQIPVLEKISYYIEEIVLRHGGKEAEMFVGFQKLSRAEAVWERYLNIADRVKKLYIFGQKNTKLKSHPNINFIYLPEQHPLIREWFLIMNLPKAKSILVAYDLDGFGKFENEKNRHFRGIKSNNPSHVKTAINLLEKII